MQFLNIFFAEFILLQKVIAFSVEESEQLIFSPLITSFFKHSLIPNDESKVQFPSPLTVNLISQLARTRKLMRIIKK